MADQNRNQSSTSRGQQGQQSSKTSQDTRHTQGNEEAGSRQEDRRRDDEAIGIGQGHGQPTRDRSMAHDRGVADERDTRDRNADDSEDIGVESDLDSDLLDPDETSER